MRYSIHLKPVSDSGLYAHLDIVKYLRKKKLTAALFHEHRVIKFEATNPGIIPYVKKQFGEHILCILSDNHGKGLYKRPSKHLSLFGPSATPLTPMQVAKAYNFPAPGPDIKDKVVAILELGGGFNPANVLNYCKSMGVAYPRMWQHNFTGGTNTEDGPDGADGEVSLDICVVAAMAPGVQILVVFAPNTTNAFIDAISNIATYFKTPDALSISWGAEEDSWDAGAQKAMNNAIKSCVDAGINVLVASGDNGSSDGGIGKHVDFPASSPYAIACGGTRLYLNSDGTREKEVVWGSNGATGGGVSTTQSADPAQEKYLGGTDLDRRVPDIAGNADPQSGYIVDVDGQQMSIGGTSAVAPLMAGLNAILASHAPAGNLKEVLYKNPGVCFDVTSGNNGAFSAKSGYDCCTGLGVPDGQKLLKVLKPSLVSKIVKFCKSGLKK